MTTKLQMLQAISRKLSGVIATTDHKARLIRKINATLDSAIGSMDAATVGKGDHWITTEGGSRVLLDKDGNIKGGMGGKFTGQNIKDTGGTKKFTKYATNAEREQAKQPTPEAKPITENESSNNLTVRDNPAKLSSTSQTEAANGDKTMNAEQRELRNLIQEKKEKLANSDPKYHAAITKSISDLEGKLNSSLAETSKKEAFNKKAESKGFHPMINHRDNGSFGVKIPFDMKDAFKKQFSSAKWDGATKEWTVGKLSGKKLNDWLQDKIPHIEEKAASKSAFEAKKAEMHPLTGQTFDIKDELKAKFGAIYDGDAKTWRVPPEHKDEAQRFVSEHNESKKVERKASRDARTKEIMREPTSEEQKSIDAWLEQNPTDDEYLRDDEFRYSVQTGGWHIKPDPKKDQAIPDRSLYSRGDD